MNKHIKIILTLIFTTCLLIGCASTENTPVLKYQEIIEFEDSLTKDFLYDRTRLWLAESFVDSKKVIELENKEQGLLVGNGGMKFTFGILAPMPGEFSLRVDIKNGRIRTTYNNFKIYIRPSQYSSGGWSVIHEGTVNGYPKQAIDVAKKLNQDLRAFINSTEEDSDW